jgi:2-keto-4-pentenoate hydratase/2-oxohepta-3-ene-1,7-dioic acid hydratase in catechol pathway
MEIDATTGLVKGTFGLGTFQFRERSFPGLVRSSGGVLDLSLHFQNTHQVFADWGAHFERLVDIDANADGTGIPYTEVRPLPPLEHPNILGSVSNYKVHVTEVLTFLPRYQKNRLPNESDESFKKRNAEWVEYRAQHGMPAFFGAHYSALIGANDDIVIPVIGKNHDWELEVTLVIGRHQRCASLEEAMTMIAGYTISNDLCTLDQSARPDLPWGSDLFTKNQATFKPCGPFIVPSQFVRFEDIRIKLEVNGEVKQNSSVADMIFSPAQLVAYASERTNLLPGTQIMTGSPPGNSILHGTHLHEGDVVTCEATGLGRHRNRCVPEVLNSDRKPVFGTFDASRFNPPFRP